MKQDRHQDYRSALQALDRLSAAAREQVKAPAPEREPVMTLEEALRRKVEASWTLSMPAVGG